jgi:hypothetical protein
VYRREAEALAAELKRRIAGEVRFDAGSCALNATDWSIYRRVAIGGSIAVMRRLSMATSTQPRSR